MHHDFLFAGDTNIRRHICWHLIEMTSKPSTKWHLNNFLVSIGPVVFKNCNTDTGLRFMILVNIIAHVHWDHASDYAYRFQIEKETQPIVAIFDFPLHINEN